MKQVPTKALVIISLTVLWLGRPDRLAAQTAGVLREVYTGIGGTTVADLTNSVNFPNNPTFEEVITAGFEAPTDVDDNYGQRLTAYVIPPTTGNYIFWIASDDYGTLYLSTNDQPANKQVIASVPGWTTSREWGKYPAQQSAPRTLTGGQRYYIEALMKEGGGGDNLAVLADTTPPTISSVVNLGDNTIVTVLFSERVEAVSGTDRFNYSIDNGVSISSAAFGGDTRSVVLTTSPLNAGATYALTVNNVRDRAATPNTIAPNSQKTFTLDFTPLDISSVRPAAEPIGPSSRRTGLTISEIMYHPTNRVDGKNLELIEIYNSQPFFEEISGYRLTGTVEYTFPTNTTIPARSYLVVAPSPADVQSAYGITGVVGGFTNKLSNGSGTVRLRNKQGAILIEVNYSGDPP